MLSGEVFGRETATISKDGAESGLVGSRDSANLGTDGTSAESSWESIKEGVAWLLGITGFERASEESSAGNSGASFSLAECGSSDLRLNKRLGQTTTMEASESASSQQGDSADIQGQWSIPRLTDD